MFRNLLVAGALIAGVVVLTGCNKNSTSTGPSNTILFSDGFENGISNKWDGVYMISTDEMYSQMRVTTDAAHSGTHSLTTDSSMTALDYRENSDSTVGTGIVGVEFYMMAKTLSQINFGVEMGKDPGSSGAVTPAFGIFFDPSDSIKCTTFANSWPYSVDSQTMVAKIQAGHWYKCKVEFNFSDSTVSYDIDDALVLSNKLAKSNLDTVLVNAFPMGINRVLAFRGTQGRYNSTSSEGAKPYYIDDITFYKK